MKTNVQPGMLAYVVARNCEPVQTPEILGRIVYVEGPVDPNHIYRHVDGRMMRDQNIYAEVVWMVSAKEPMPAMVHIPGQPSEVWYVHERTLYDACLRPLIDPNLNITEDEVTELYSPKEPVCQT